MSVIRGIRERSGLVVGTIAIGLMLFIVGGDLLSQNSRIKGMSSQTVGEISGKEIKLTDYQAELDQLIQNYTANSGKSPSGQDLNQIREQAWNQFIFKTAFQEEFDAAGLSITEDEMIDMVQGNHIHPSIKQAFTNPQTGQFDKSNVINYLKNISKMEPAQQQVWYNFEKSLGPDRLREKYMNLIKKSVYVTNLEAKQNYLAENNKVDFQYLYVPFYSIVDSTIEVTDAEVASYYAENKDKYKGEPNRGIDYVEFLIAPTKEDTAYFMNEMKQIATDFVRTEDDSLYVRANSDAPYANTYMSISELPESFTSKMDINAMTKDSVYGPFVDGGVIKIYKLLDSREGTDEAVRASHILFNTQGKSDDDKKAAKTQCMDILKKIKGGADFAEMARQYGSDGTASRGGDLGWFKKGTMVKPFEDACFNAPGIGLIGNIVETDFGYHIVKITQAKTKKQYLLATIERGITAGDNTREMIFRKADAFAAKVKNADEFNAEITAQKLQKMSAPVIMSNDYNVSGLREAREIVRWAYNDASKGDVSKVYELEDRYVVALLTKVNKDGYPEVDDIKDQLKVEVRNKKKADKIMEKIKGLSGGLQDMATKYGPEAVYRTANMATITNPSISGLGFDPIAIGKAFGMGKGKKSAPFVGSNGVVIMEILNTTPAPEIKDYSNYKMASQSKVEGRLDNSVNETVKKAADIKDERYKFY